MHLSVLFIPFEAAIQHYRRQSTHGVSAYRVDVGVKSKKRKARFDDEISIEQSSSQVFDVHPSRKRRKMTTTKGVTLVRSSLSKMVPSVVSQCWSQVIADDDLQYFDTSVSSLESSLSTSPSQRLFVRLASRYRERMPDILFLSEKPGEVDFPPKLIIPGVLGQSVVYLRLGATGTRKTQIIAGYHRLGLQGSFKAKSYTKRTKTHGADEHVLVIERTLLEQRFAVAGFHLSAKNVSASEQKKRRSVAEMQNFCRLKKVDLALGDFNLDIRDFLEGGGVGRVPKTQVFMAQFKHSIMGERFREQFSNSTNTKHFMGYVPMKSGVTITNALSLERSVAGVYFSDHPPLFVEASIS